MFWSSLTRLRDRLEIFEDFLGDPAEDATVRVPQSHTQVHPHRRPLRWERERRPGTVLAPAAVCLSPVRRGRVREEPRTPVW